ncbi:MAG: transposase [Desulfomonilaceae bacterium]
MALVIGWVLTVGNHTVSQVILTMRLHESRHFATIYRFLGKGQWGVDWVSHCLFRIMVEILVAEDVKIVVVLDDTLNKHRGKKICGAGCVIHNKNFVFLPTLHHLSPLLQLYIQPSSDGLYAFQGTVRIKAFNLFFQPFEFLINR